MGNDLRKRVLLLLSCIVPVVGHGGEVDRQGFELLFDGKSLDGWHGDLRYWSVQDGAITGSSEKIKLEKSTYLYSEKSSDNFELHFKYRINSEWGNSGVQYRSRVKDPRKYTIEGYQADIAVEKYNGILYEVEGRQMIALRGEKVLIDKDGKKSVVGKTCDTDAAHRAVRTRGWNDYVVIAYKNKLRHVVNGHTMIEVEDREPGKGALSGVFAFQMHQGPTMSVQFKDIKIKKLDAFPAATPVKPPVIPKKTKKSAGLDLLPGYEAELVYSVDDQKQGSWISMTFDNKGRLITTAEGGGLYRLIFPGIGKVGKTVVEEIKVKEAENTRGLLYAFDSLYVATDAIYRLQDSNGDDQFDKVTRILGEVTSYKEHGSHAIIVSADGKGIDFINGNMSPFRDKMPSRQPPVWGEDSLLPHYKVSHAHDIVAPGAWLCRFDPDGKNPVMLASGMRNPCDMAYNGDGELFTYDADMEYDMGTSWYRPTRINHLTSGAEFGWRTGSQKWPDYFADSLGSVVDIGAGCPTGVVFGTKARFPREYRDCLYVCDWTFGALYAVHLEESGASYTGRKETFLAKMGLPLVDVEVGPDGALYVMTGGWKNHSDIYRIHYTGRVDEVGAGGGRSEPAKQSRELRKRLERHHRSVGQAAVDEAWEHLSHPDRAIRYAARIAVENQPLEYWRDRVLAETDPAKMIYGVLALARHGDESDRAQVVDKLAGIDFAKLADTQQMDLLRAYGLVFIRWGAPTASATRKVLTQLETHYPASDRFLNRELSRLLAYLQSPQVVAKTIALMKKEKPRLESYQMHMEAALKRGDGNYTGTIAKMLENTPNVQNVHYLYVLKNVTTGWTREDRDYYFSCLKKNLSQSGGRRYHYYLDKIKDEALKNVPAEEVKSMARLFVEAKPFDLTSLPKAKGPGKSRSDEEVIALVKTGMQKRSFNQGQKMYAAAHCAVCHQFNGQGGLAGPDLSNLANRFSLQDILVSVNEPHKAINKFYQASEITLHDGSLVFGQVIEQTEKELKMMTNAYDPARLTTVRLDDIKERKLSPTSQMPGGLISMFNEEELLDFFAYVLSKGNRRHQYYKK
jgi:putative heme-binding domain-containing protein